MKAAVIYQPGGPEEFRLEERPIPQAKFGTVLVKVKAFGLNRSELMTRKGYSPNVVFPRILGIECVGEVVQDPSSNLQPGQQVAACMGGMGRVYDGSYAEYTLLSSDIVYPFVSNLPWATLGALPEMFQTVYGSLFLALDVKKGETLLIRGGTSSIGLLALQLAKNAGLNVIATTRNPDKKQLLLEHNADDVWIDSGNLLQRTEQYPEEVDKILELVGTNTLKDSMACVKVGGTVCMTGMLSEQWGISDFAPMDYIPATTKLTVYDSGQIRVGREHFKAFIKDIEDGKVKLPIGKVYTLDSIKEAHQLMDNNEANGKIVVLTNE
ncbi:zinc-binding alcohol dehydrogenase family protein [Runella aurantiaca]|uniref:NADPH:quinone reductase n=1 Tax=Runella aurantiaca TaxID=2282308 RepID=A0A369HYH1_9BACT|nr:zinc-binding alcohol dehydrogenase family protein [Runella aurantiaca]RDB02569.1 NADPH:quinone reductase [Runella aurantiaca]